MIILSIETSCDETAVSLVRASGDFPSATYEVLGNALFSQIDIHRQYGGVFPAVAKREHAKTLVPLLERALQEAQLLEERVAKLSPELDSELATILNREPGLGEALTSFLENHNQPLIDLIAVTSGPGLEPTLWVGINFARALSTAWNIPVVPVNHMEGHILSSIFDGTAVPQITFPAITLLISGGHTEIISFSDWTQYERIGETRDDAVGEAFDKVARMLGLPYPGGPEIGRLAAEAREQALPLFQPLPRPMLDSDNLDFSFSGLKTAVRYAIADKVLTAAEKAAVAREFENAVTEVLLNKCERAVSNIDAQTLIVGGGVSANTYIRESFLKFFSSEYPSLAVHFPPQHLSTDNSVMIALSGHARALRAHHKETVGEIIADGNRSLTDQ